MGLILKSLMPAYGGYTIARDEKVIFIKGAIPGEVVEVDIEEKKRDYSIAYVRNVIEPSEYRSDPLCRVFGICGGCQLQFINYERQLTMKDEILIDSISRLGGIEIDLSPAISGEQWNYRHRAQFKISRNGDIGFFKESSRDVVTFESCPLLNEEINTLLLRIKGQDIVRNLSEMHISAGDIPVALLKGKDYDMTLLDKFIDSGLSGMAYNDAIVYGGAYTEFDLNGLKYTVSPWTFFQAHWGLNRKVVDFVMSQIMPLSGKRILDLYAGAGNFSVPMAVHAGEVVAVEENPYAVDDGNRNLEVNDIRNCRFIKSSSEKYRIKDRFDIILLDPPRPGLTSEVSKKILENPAEQIVYISCNPATLARDLKKFKEKYEIKSIRQIDFFPQTFHIEAVAFLSIR
ncbi:MAG: class I SAM-dependent RNA methyltransferase [Nitrospirota bacterium]